MPAKGHCRCRLQLQQRLPPLQSPPRAQPRRRKLPARRSHGTPPAASAPLLPRPCRHRMYGQCAVSIKVLALLQSRRRTLPAWRSRGTPPAASALLPPRSCGKYSQSVSHPKCQHVLPLCSQFTQRRGAHVVIRQSCTSATKTRGRLLSSMWHCMCRRPTG